ncbi:MAG: 2-oxoglutarate dehydrogenase E1 component [Alphaproteobacteria bacterium]|nr:2-oxoglutarate dehydrogenase E1 component [Alphaproteobacteria bacterium]
MTTQQHEDSFLYGTNSPFIEALYQTYRQNPQNVSEDWRQFFQGLGPDAGATDDRPPKWKKRVREVIERSIYHKDSENLSQVTQGMLDSLRALMMIRTFRVRGHLIAHLDPLALERRISHPEVDPATYNFGPDDYDRPIFINKVLGFEWATLRQILDRLKSTYCETVGVEFMHIQDPDQKAWIQERVENTPIKERVNDASRKKILHDLIRADSFEHFLHVKFAGEKRFGLEGGETLIPALEAILSKVVQQNVGSVVFGTAHRGRLSILANILDKPLSAIFVKFSHDQNPFGLAYGSGDVKYHLGFSGDRQIEGRSVHLSLASNPSHLEAINPVVLGKVRAQQTRIGDEGHNQVIALLLHGDAAFAGQGLVAETLELSGLKGYQTGGTIHLIINNQIGFTTSPPHSRSSPYSSDIAKAIQAPIFHVNADDPEAVVWVSELAAEFRNLFAQDVVVDMVCYRRYGHNEMDEPSFTQPKMYKAIANHPTTCKIYTDKMLESGLVTPEDVESFRALYEVKLNQEYEKAAQAVKDAREEKIDWLEGIWTGIKPPKHLEDHDENLNNTGVSGELLKEVGIGNFHVPEGFALHPRIARQFDLKRKVIESGEGIDWATAEALAIGSLLMENNPVRLSGQDCSRGTFSQRHAVWIDQETEEKHVPLNHLKEGQALFQIVDSPLAEASVLGFEYGYSLSSPHTLVMWEAQFGDFANGAQVIIDQFISSGEIKWLRLSGLVMLLPHGYEGQGPEHTSGRLERFLQLCAESNMRVANCTTPANFFHILRRQIRSDTRKPLIVMTPKSLLRHPKAVSSLKDMDVGSYFQTVIPDTLVAEPNTQRVVLCSGKVYYDLFEEREKQGIQNVALVRLEQFYPFPREQLLSALRPYGQAELVWCQEEPLNMGAWSFLDRRLESVLIELGNKHTRPVYVGRKAAASPATGVLSRHALEQQELVFEALGLSAKEAEREKGK